MEKKKPKLCINIFIDLFEIQTIASQRHVLVTLIVTIKRTVYFHGRETRSRNEKRARVLLETKIRRSEPKSSGPSQSSERTPRARLTAAYTRTCLRAVELVPPPRYAGYYFDSGRHIFSFRSGTPGAGARRRDRCQSGLIIKLLLWPRATEKHVSVENRSLAAILRFRCDVFFFSLSSKPFF